MTFDWDEANIVHLARHNVSTDEAEQAAMGELLIVDSGWVDDEYRYRALSETKGLRVLEFVFTERQLATRVVSAWTAPRALKLEYLEWRVEL